MAQGKLKIKAKLPENAKGKSKGGKGAAVTKRASMSFFSGIIFHVPKYFGIL